MLQQDDEVQTLQAVHGVNAQSYLTFCLREEVFGVDIRKVREILPCGTMTQVPLMSDIVRGVINLRGAVVPVIDLNRLLGRPRGVADKKSCIVVFDTRNDGATTPLGVMVDAVSEVITIADAAIEAAPQFGVSVERDFILGMAKVGEQFVVLLDAERSFDVEALLGRL